MIQLIPKIPTFQMFRHFGFPRLTPINLTVSVTYRCNSKCKTCNIYEKKANEFTLEEFGKTFQSIGSSPYWLTISGGEPFLRKDLVDICQIACQELKPKIINIPTNGILSKTIAAQVDHIVQNSPKTEIIINLSLDEIDEKHDEIRNVRDNFTKAIETYNKLRQLDYSNLTIGIHSVISKYNVHNFPNIYDELIKLEPDSFITEIAEERVELGTVGQDIQPSIGKYSEAIDFLCARIREQKYNGISKITQAFRLQYYELVKKTLKEKRQILPCYAGFMSAQIAPDGEVWACCIKAESMGNLREVDYDFKKVWLSEQARKIRKPIREKQCYCPLANASYTNMLVSYPTVARILKDMTIKKFKKESFV